MLAEEGDDLSKVEIPKKAEAKAPAPAKEEKKETPGKEYWIGKGMGRTSMDHGTVLDLYTGVATPLKASKDSDRDGFMRYDSAYFLWTELSLSLSPRRVGKLRPFV